MDYRATVNQKKLPAMTSPAGRTVTTTVDSQDRPLAIKAPSLATVAYAYDARGRLASIAVGTGDRTRTAGFAYYSSGPPRAGPSP